MHLVGLTKLRTAVVTLVAAAALQPAATPAQANPAVQLIDLSPAQAALVTHVVDLFAAAGLELPPLVVRLGTGVPRCNDRPGLHHIVDGRSEILLCYPKIAGREFRVFAHELAHAWATTGLTDERRARFQAVRGWEHWHDYDRAKWGENGTEQAAEIIKWGISDIPVPVFVKDASCEALRDGYVALTGGEPLHGRTELCEPQAQGPPDPRAHAPALAWAHGTVGPWAP